MRAIVRHTTSAPAMSAEPSPTLARPGLTLIAIAFVALWCEQVSHELTHGFAALLAGKDWQGISFWASASAWPEGVTPSAAGDGIVAGSAAILNILAAFVSMVLFGGPWARARPLTRLFLFYFAAYSWFAGFGYLLFDPLFAGEGSAGDWAKVTMLLGGSWLAVRLPLILIGSAGTISGYFYFGRAGLRLAAYGDSGIAERGRRLKVGRLLFLAPYVAVNTVFTLLALNHPLGITGLVIVAMKVWLGFIGLFWAYMIVFVWMELKDPPADLTPLPAGPLSPRLLALCVVLLVVALLTGPGVALGPNGLP